MTDAASSWSADVVVVGDGPAGSALASALRSHGVDVMLVGPDEPWAATYTSWADDLESLDLFRGIDPWRHRFDEIEVCFATRRAVARGYGVIDNDRVRAHLRDGVRHVSAHVGSLEEIDARVVVDATGWPSAFDRRPETMASGNVGWQTAFGVVLKEPPSGALRSPTMMDFSDPGASILGREHIPTFAYSLPVGDGWLVEETVLTASPAVDPELLGPVLAARLGTTLGALLERSVRVESVRIPMGAPPASGDEAVGLVRFGAAAGMIHPATGYSVGSAFRAADRVASAIALAIERNVGGEAIDLASIHAAVWPAESRRTRRLHDYGHAVLAKLDRSGVHEFFDTFFELPATLWPGYMRIDTPPRRLAGIMTAMFKRAPWTLRARLMSGGPRRLIRVLRR